MKENKFLKITCKRFPETEIKDLPCKGISKEYEGCSCCNTCKNSGYEIVPGAFIPQGYTTWKLWKCLENPLRGVDFNPEKLIAKHIFESKYEKKC